MLFVNCIVERCNDSRVQTHNYLGLVVMNRGLAGCRIRKAILLLATAMPCADNRMVACGDDLHRACCQCPTIIPDPAIRGEKALCRCADAIPLLLASFVHMLILLVSSFSAVFGPLVSGNQAGVPRYRIVAGSLIFGSE